jgi:hypothetical protein
VFGIPFHEVEELDDPPFLGQVLVPRSDAEMRIREEVRLRPAGLPLLPLLLLRPVLLGLVTLLLRLLLMRVLMGTLLRPLFFLRRRTFSLFTSRLFGPRFSLLALSSATMGATAATAR